MSINRRGFLGGVTALIASPKTLLKQRAAGGLLPAASFVRGSKGFIPARLIEGDIVRVPQYRMINGVYRKLAPSEIFSKNNIEAFENSQDTSNVSFEFGVSIYSDPSGVFINEK